MICSKCGTWNEQGCNFCRQCGSPLTNEVNNSMMSGTGMNPVMQNNGMSPMMQNNGMNPMMRGNGMSPMPQGNGFNPIKPKKSYTGLIVVLIAIASAIAIAFFSFVLIRVAVKSDGEDIEQTEEVSATLDTEETVKDVVEEITIESTEETTEKVTEETKEEPSTEYETLPITSEIYKALEGGWDGAADGGAYWEFRNGEYWWYKTREDLTDNYWYGTTEIIVGRAGIEMVGLNADAVDEMISRGEGKITEDSIYTIICTPKKIISGGIDKSDTNIPEGQTLKYVWVLVDYGEEGVEAQTIHLSSYETYYYVKVED